MVSRGWSEANGRVFIILPIDDDADGLVDDGGACLSTGILICYFPNDIRIDNEQ